MDHVHPFSIAKSKSPDGISPAKRWTSRRLEAAFWGNFATENVALFCWSSWAIENTIPHEINGAEDLSGERIVYSSGNGMFFMLSLHMIFLQKCKILRLSRNFFHDFPRTNYQAFPTKGLVTAPHIPTNWQPVIAHPVMILQTRRGHDGNRSRTWKALGRLLQGSQQLGMSENGGTSTPWNKKANPDTMG